MIRGGLASLDRSQSGQLVDFVCVLNLYVGGQHSVESSLHALVGGHYHLPSCHEFFCLAVRDMSFSTNGPMEGGLDQN